MADFEIGQTIKYRRPVWDGCCGTRILDALVIFEGYDIDGKAVIKHPDGKLQKLQSTGDLHA